MQQATFLCLKMVIFKDPGTEVSKFIIFNSLCPFNSAWITQKRLKSRESSFEPSFERGTLLQRNVANSNTLKEIKKHLPRDMFEIHKLWGPEGNDFAYDEQRIAALLRDAATIGDLYRCNYAGRRRSFVADTIQ